jgi:hypothetical protein
MSGFAIRHPFFILMLCLIVVVVGVTTVARMPVDLHYRHLRALFHSRQQHRSHRVALADRE